MSPTQLTIRQATPDDAQEITTLHAAGWRKGYAAFFDPEVLEQAIEERRTRWTDLLKKRDREGTLLFVGEQDGMIVAFAHAGPARDHPGDLEIYSFYTHPTYWGSGIGRRLMMHVLAFALTRGYVRMYLYVYSQSVRARRFYTRLGFSETGRTTATRLPGDVVTRDIEYVHDGQNEGSSVEAAARRDHWGAMPNRRS
ncbi:MAG: GNAT family N-acetyltransferase [Actinomycetota bacterium]